MYCVARVSQHGAVIILARVGSDIERARCIASNLNDADMRRWRAPAHAVFSLAEDGSVLSNEMEGLHTTAAEEKRATA